MGLGISFFGGGGGSGGLVRVADDAARLALTPTDGLVVIQLDRDELWEYDLTTVAWVMIGGVSPTFTDVTIKNSIILEEPGAGTDTITIQSPAAITAWTFTLPPDDGTADYVLRTDGAGVSTWAQVSLTAGVTGILPLANGGSNKNMTAVAGGVVWTDADSMEVTAAGTAGQLLVSTGTTAPAWTTVTYPTTVTAPAVMVANANDVWSALAATTPARVLKTDGSAVSFGQVDLAADVTGVLPMANGGSNKNLTASAGGIVWTDADSMEVLAGTATAGLALVSGASATPSWFAPTEGSVIFAGVGGILQQDNANFFYDDTNDYLGLGVTTPQYPLHVHRAGATLCYMSFTNGTTGSAVGDGFAVGILTTGVAQVRQRENNHMTFFTNNSQRMIITAGGCFAMQNSTGTQIATTATDGFFRQSSCAGTPTGVPSALNGVVPTVVDTTNNLLYYYTNSIWRTAGGFAVQNTRQTGLSMSAATTITPGVGTDTTCFVVGNGGAVTITAGTPIVMTNMVVGQVLKIAGTSDTNTVTFDSGNNLVLNGSCTLAKDQVLTLMYAGSDGTNSAWIEQSRSA